MCFSSLPTKEFYISWVEEKGLLRGKQEERDLETSDLWD